MNERIRELKHLASVWCDENIPEQYSEETNGYGKAWEDKFAELIVQECMTVARKADGLDAEYEAWYLIKQHFGVEE